MKIINAIKCKAGKHQYVITRRVTNAIVELECEHCGKEFVIHAGVKCLLPMDRQLKLTNDYMLGEKTIQEIF